MTTLVVLLESLLRYVGWWGQALCRWRDPCAPMSLRRALVLLVGMPLFVLVQGMHALCLVLDELLFPGYRRINVGRAVFITGIPRSGTTFLHRTLAVDEQRYTTMTTWEALLAPSITQRKLLKGLGRLDQWLGGWGHRGLEAGIRRMTGDFAAIHDVGLHAAEEDYLSLLPAGGCFIMLLAFPASPGLMALGHFSERMPEKRRQRLLRFYEGCLQRHLYADGAHRQLLSKNAAFGSWLAGLQQRFPQARFMICVREPVSALSSQLSSLQGGAHQLGTRTSHPRFQQRFLDLFRHTLQHLAETLAHSDHCRSAILDMDDMRRHPATLISRALDQLNESAGADLAEHLRRLPAGTASRHRHGAEALALSRDTMETAMQPAYRRLIALPQRIRSLP